MIRKLFALFVAITLLSACAIIPGGRALYEDSISRADARLEQLIAAINSRDDEALKELFSEKTVEDTIDFDESIEHLYEYIGGEIISWESEGSSGGEDSKRDGHRKKIFRSYYYVNTDKEKYFFLLTDCFIDTNNPNEVGYYLLIATKADEDDKVFDKEQKILFDGDTKLSPTGILIPFE